MDCVWLRNLSIVIKKLSPKDRCVEKIIKCLKMSHIKFSLGAFSFSFLFSNIQHSSNSFSFSPIQQPSYNWTRFSNKVFD